MKRKKLSNKAKGKILIILSTLMIIGISLAIFISQFRFDILGDVLKAYLGAAIENGAHIVILMLIACPLVLVLMRAFIDHIIPMIYFFISKPFKYLAIWWICRKNGYSCRFHRPPFASMWGVCERSDIEIQMDKKTLHVHFIDIPFPISKMFLLFNDREYRIHKTIVGKIKRDGVIRGPNMSGQKVGVIRSGAIEMDEANFDAYIIPEFPPKGTEYHYLVIDPSYADAYFINDKTMLTVTGECLSGNLILCKWKILKKRLKNKLYNPLK